MPFDNTNIINDELTDLINLRAARHRIRIPSLWCKGHYRSSNRFCITGAVDAITFGDHNMNASMLDILAKHLPKDSRYDSIRHRIVAFNDQWNTTHRDVMALFDAAITELETRNE